MKRFVASIVTLGMVLGVGVSAVALVPAAQAVSPQQEITNGVNAAGNDPNAPSLKSRLKTITNILLFILGAIAVIMVIVGGLQYTTSGGDSAQTKKAKDTILYSIVGVIVAILAYAIVNFVVGSF